MNLKSREFKVSTYVNHHLGICKFENSKHNGIADYSPNLYPNP
jgi:hypothetical protein